MTKKITMVDFASLVVKHICSNGFELYMLPNPQLKTMALRMSLNAEFESLETNPLSSVAAPIASEMLLKGSKQFSGKSVAISLESMCLSSVSFTGNPSRLQFAANIVSDDLKPLLDITSDALLNPSFNTQEFGVLIDQAIGQCLAQKSETGIISAINLSQKLYTKSSRHYRDSPDSKIANLQKLDVSVLKVYLGRMISAKHRFMVLTGGFNMATVVDFVEQTFGKLPAQESTQNVTAEAIDLLNEVAADCGNSVVRTQIPNKTSVDINIAFPLDFDRRSSEYEALLIASNILGGDTLTSRLGKEVRVKQGLTYGITSGFSDTNFTHSPYTISVTVNPANIDKTLVAIEQVVTEFLANGVTSVELETEVTSLIAQVQVSRRTNMAICSAIFRTLEQNLPLSKLNTQIDKLKALNIEVVNMAIKRHFKPAYENCKVTSIAGSIERS